MKVVSCSNDPGIGESVARIMNVDLIKTFFKKFPDGELYVRVEENLNGEDIVVVQTTYPNQNESLIELYFTIDSLRSYKPHKLIVVVPYLAYMRQDKRFLMGESLSAKVIISILNMLNIDYFITVDIHNDYCLKWFKCKVINIHAAPLLVNYFRERVSKPIILSPDIGSLSRAMEAANTLKADYDFLIKVRDRVTGGIQIKPKKIDVAGRDVIIIDDIISTGGTIINAATMLRKLGVNKLFVGCTHPLLINNALEKILKARVDDVVGSNSVRSTISKVQLQEEIVKSIKEII
ncbi:MAG: ribose-phosphate diphosphokinase [Candidatus Methanomethylicia archaeon]